MVAWWPFELWNSCRITGTTECGAMITSWFNPCMYHCFCRRPSAEIISGWQLFLFLWCKCKAKFQQIMSFCLVQSLSLCNVCILFSTTFATHSSVSLIGIVFRFSSGSVYIFSVFNWEIVSDRMLLLPLIWTKVKECSLIIPLTNDLA